MAFPEGGTTLYPQHKSNTAPLLAFGPILGSKSKVEKYYRDLLFVYYLLLNSRITLEELLCLSVEEVTISLTEVTLYVNTDLYYFIWPLCLSGEHCLEVSLLNVEPVVWNFCAHTFSVEAEGVWGEPELGVWGLRKLARQTVCPAE